MDSVRPVASEFFLVCRRLETAAQSNLVTYHWTASAYLPTAGSRNLVLVLFLQWRRQLLPRPVDGVRPVASEFFLVGRQPETEASSNFVPTRDSVRPVASEFFLVCRQLEISA